MSKETAPRSRDRAQDDLRKALDRLKSGIPQDPDLACKAKAGKLRINPTTVAKEAGRARTLIGYDGCTYMNIRTEILATRERAIPTVSFDQVVQTLRADVSRLKEEVTVAMSRVAAMQLCMHANIRKAERRVAEIERTHGVRRDGPVAESVAAESVVRKVAGSKVVSIVAKGSQRRPDRG
ncbi:hypothetical protein [Paraburkholderia sediminicola]|uniref:hypothetical protein n=1 Tax=Paraburkholderia sediminicola TaxID=458836 RepID=UPI0038BCCCC0